MIISPFQVTSFPEPSFPPPPAPLAPSAPPMTLKIQNGPTSYQDPGGGKKMNAQDSVDDWDDEWDDDQSSNSTTQVTVVTAPPPHRSP